MTQKISYIGFRENDVLGKVNKATLKTLQNDPLVLARLVRNSKQAEISHFMNVVKNKAERDLVSLTKINPIDMDYFEKDWIDAEMRYKQLFPNGSPLKQKTPYASLSGIKSDRSIIKRRIKTENIDLTPVAVKQTINAAAQDTDENFKSTETHALMFHENPSEDLEYLPLSIANRWPYDGVQRTQQMEQIMENFRRKDNNKEFTIKIPPNAKVQNKHMCDYYLVKKTKKLPPMVTERKKTEEQTPALLKNSSKTLQTNRKEPTQVSEPEQSQESFQESLDNTSRLVLRRPSKKEEVYFPRVKTKQPKPQGQKTKKQPQKWGVFKLLEPMEVEALLEEFSISVPVQPQDDNNKPLRKTASLKINNNKQLRKENQPKYTSYWLQRIKDILKHEQNHPECVLDAPRIGYYLKFKITEREPPSNLYQELEPDLQATFQVMYQVWSKVNEDFLAERTSHGYDCSLISEEPGSLYTIFDEA